MRSGWIRKILDKDPNATGRVDVLQAMEGPKGLRDMPTSGYSGLIAISKSSVKTEEDLKKVLSFLDQLNEPELQALLYNGLEGKQYEKKKTTSYRALTSLRSATCKV